MAELEDESTRTGRLLEVLSSFGTWLVIAYVALAVVVVWLFVVSGDRRRDEALHRGEVIADARAKVNSCLTSRPALTKINRFASAVLDFHLAAYENALAIAKATPKTDPTYRTRLRNAERIGATIPPVRAIRFHVPTRAECLKLGETRYGRVGPSVPPPNTGKP